MPGEFYIEGKKEKVSLVGLETALAELEGKLDHGSHGLAALKTLIDEVEGKGDAIKDQTEKLAGEPPVTGSATQDWQAAESDVVAIGSAGVRNKIHDLTLSIHNLVGTSITVRLYKRVNDIERCVYQQTFDAISDPPGLPIINGTWALHGVLRATLQSNNAADDGKAVDYDFMLEAM